MDGFLWLLLPLFVAAGSALLAFYIMQSKLEVALAREREALAEAKATLQAHTETFEQKLKAVEETTQRKSLENFLADIRVEERHYVRETRSRFASRKAMVLQERLFFRNIPLSDWIEHEMVVEEGGDLAHLARACSIFASKNGVEAGQDDGKLMIQ